MASPPELAPYWEPLGFPPSGPRKMPASQYAWMRRPHGSTIGPFGSYLASTILVCSCVPNCPCGGYVHPTLIVLEPGKAPSSLILFMVYEPVRSTPNERV